MEIDEAKAAPDLKEFILMSYDPSPWKSELYMTVTKEVPGEKNVKISGTFISKVFEGGYNEPPKWIKEFDKFDKYLAGQRKKAKKYYFYFTYCPKCSKKYGHNYGVVFAQVA